MTRFRGVYGVFDGPRLMYVGSSTLGLSKLEYNHRNWNIIGYKWTEFRGRLIEQGKGWHFVWLVRPYEATAVDIETKEGILIRMLKPALNVDMDPVESSIKYGRYVREDVTNETL